MDNFSRHKMNKLKAIMTFFFLSIFILTTLSCQPLRRKFTRKKKKDRHGPQFIPVLDPIDYADKVQSSEERYRYHYSLWKVWEKDLLSFIEAKGSDKKQKYLLEQLINQLEEMNKWLVEEKQKELRDIIKEYINLRKVYTRPNSMRNIYSLKRKLRLSGKKIRIRFKPSEAKEHFIK